MSQLATIADMGKKRTGSDADGKKQTTSDRHKNYLMLRIKKGLMYRLKRIAAEHDRDTTRHVVKFLWSHVLDEEIKLGLGEMTIDDVMRVADKDLTTEQAESIVESSGVEELSRKRKQD